METAAEKFKVGQHVRMTSLGIERRLDGQTRRRTGIVGKFPTRGALGDPELLAKLVRVKRDGDKASRVFHMDFWEPVE